MHARATNACMHAHVHTSTQGVQVYMREAARQVCARGRCLQQWAGWVRRAQGVRAVERRVVLQGCRGLAMRVLGGWRGWVVRRLADTCRVMRSRRRRCVWAGVGGIEWTGMSACARKQTCKHTHARTHARTHTHPGRFSISAARPARAAAPQPSNTRRSTVCTSTAAASCCTRRGVNGRRVWRPRPIA